MTLKSIIVDDEPAARKLLQEYIEDISFLELAGQADNPLKAQDILNNESIDLIFLDINMPKLTGIEFLRTASSLPMVIITTAYAEYALDGFTLDVLDYLIKPFSFERFLKACNKAREYQALKHQATQKEAARQNYFFVKCNGRIEKVFHDELLFVEASLNYITLHTLNGKMIVYLTIKSMIENLPADAFIKVHKSFIVNMQKISSIEGNILHIGKAEIPVSQNFYETTMKTILKDRMLKR